MIWSDSTDRIGLNPHLNIKDQLAVDNYVNKGVISSLTGPSKVSYHLIYLQVTLLHYKWLINHGD